jgi:hypothetical protein
MPCLSGVGLLSKIMTCELRKRIPVVSKLFILVPMNAICVLTHNSILDSQLKPHWTTPVCERRAESRERRAAIWRAESVEEIKIATLTDQKKPFSKIDQNIPIIFQNLPKIVKKDLFPWDV